MHNHPILVFGFFGKLKKKLEKSITIVRLHSNPIRLQSQSDLLERETLKHGSIEINFQD